MKRIFSIVYIIAVCIILVVPGILWIIGAEDPRPFFDNRLPAPKPEFNLARLDPYPAQFESYFNDHFPYRNSAIFTLNYSDARFFNKSPDPSAVTVGTHGWLYGGTDQMQSLLGIKPFTDEMITATIAELNYRYERCREAGAEYRLVIIPAKSSLYPEYLPPAYRAQRENLPVEAFMKRCKTECKAPVLYLLDSLRAHKAERLLYQRSDSHWNDDGTYFAYRSIMNWMNTDGENRKLFDLDRSQYTEKERAGDYSGMLGLGDYWKDTLYLLNGPDDSIVHDRNRENYPCDSSWFSYCYQYEVAYQNTDTTLPGLLVIRDSYTNNLMQHLLGSHFGRTTFIWDYWQHKLNLEIVQKEKPKVVLCMMSEQFLRNIMRYKCVDEPGGANFMSAY